MRPIHDLVPVAGLVVHDHGDELVVLDFERQLAHRLAGRAASVFDGVRTGAVASAPEDVVDGLVACGLLARVGEPAPVVPRRSLISVAAAIGVTTLVLPPSSAAASSTGGATGFAVSSSTPYFGVVEFAIDSMNGSTPVLAGALTDFATRNLSMPRYVDPDSGAIRAVASDDVFTVPNGVNTITVTAYGSNGEGASGLSGGDFGDSLGGTVTMSYSVLPGDRFKVVAGSAAPGGSGSASTQFGALRGGTGGRGIGIYKIGTNPVWVAVAGGGGGVGGVEASSTGRGPNGGSGGIDTSKGDGTESAFAGSGRGGRNGVAQPGNGAAGFDGPGTADEGGSGSANGRTFEPATTTTAPVPPFIPDMWLGDGGAGGNGGIGGGAGGSGYFGGGGGGAGSGSGSGANLGYGGGGGAGGSFAVELGRVGEPTYGWFNTPHAWNPTTKTGGPKLVVEFDIVS